LDFAGISSKFYGIFERFRMVTEYIRISRFFGILGILGFLMNFWGVFRIFGNMSGEKKDGIFGDFWGFFIGI
jgi:hypothetical protein